MIVELIVAFISLCLLVLNAYILLIYIVHRNLLTPTSILQANFATSNLITSYYFTTATFDQVFRGSDIFTSAEQSSGWNMTLSSLSATSWSFCVVLWYLSPQKTKGNGAPTWTAAYGLISANWLYFTVLTLAHLISIYGWTFDSHDGIFQNLGWIVFVLIPFLLPWMVQGFIFTDVHPFFLTIRRKAGCQKSRKEEAMATDDVPLNTEEKEDDTQEGGDLVDSQFSSHQCIGLDGVDASSLETLSNIFVSGFVSMLLTLFSGIAFIHSSSNSIMMTLFLALICITWINCSVAPLIVVLGDKSTEDSKLYLDRILRALFRSVYSYISIYSGMLKRASFTFAPPHPDKQPQSNI